MFKKYLILFIMLTLVSALVLTLAACNKLPASGSNNPDNTGASSEKASDGNSQGNNKNEEDGKTGTGTSQNDLSDDGNSGSDNNAAGGGFILPRPGVRPYAVMIDNEGTRPLPQGGLASAQLIYEIIVEGGVTRLMPVFWNTSPDMIGPVRSARHYFLDFAMENDAIYVHIGWSPMAMRDIPAFRISNINGLTGAGAIFHDLTNDRGNWQDSYTSMKKIQEYADKRKLRTETPIKPLFTYNAADTEPMQDREAEKADGTGKTEKADGTGKTEEDDAAGKTEKDNATVKTATAEVSQKAEKISIRFSTGYKCGFEYNSKSRSYLRYRQGLPQLERITGRQLTAKNIIIQFARFRTITGDKAGRQELFDVGKGEGLFITCGKAWKISWSKASRSTQTKYLLGDGSQVVLNPGQTWVEVVYSRTNVDIK